MSLDAAGEAGESVESTTVETEQPATSKRATRISAGHAGLRVTRTTLQYATRARYWLGCGVVVSLGVAFEPENHMPSAQISSYTAHVGRLGPLGTDRLLILTHDILDADDHPVKRTSEVYFSDRFAASTGGFNTEGGQLRVRAHLPAEDFALWLDLLRNEAPVYLHWSVSDEPGAAESDGIIHLATGPEPTGEGPVDHSY
jgi:hypothetical protein